MRGDVTDNIDDLFWPTKDEGQEWDELSHIKEQYDIKCDELLAAMLENRRLSLIILKHGLDSELEINDETCENDQEDS